MVDSNPLAILQMRRIRCFGWTSLPLESDPLGRFGAHTDADSRVRRSFLSFWSQISR